jgi:type I restriction enzyme S subunit
MATKKQKIRNVPNLRFPGFEGEWEQKKLGDCSTSIDYGMNAAATVYDGQNKYIRITDIEEKSSKYVANPPVSPDSELTEKYVVKEDDILFARTGASTGKSYLYDINDGKLYFAGFLIRARIKEKYNARFLFAQTQTDSYRRWVQLMSMRSGQPGINSQEYCSYKMVIPTRKEQDKIASFLLLLDNRIDTQNKIIEKLETLIKYMRENLFCDIKSQIPLIRFHGFKNKWTKVKLVDIVSRVTRRNKENLTTLPLTIAAKHGLVDQTTFFNKQIASKDMSNYYFLLKGDFAYNKSYSNDYPWGAVKRLDLYDKGALSSLYICFRPNDDVNSDYLAHYFETTKWYKGISDISGEGARNHGLLNMSVDDYFNTSHYIPGDQEQNRIAFFLNSLSNRLTIENNILQRYKKQKNYLLQTLFI